MRNKNHKVTCVTYYDFVMLYNKRQVNKKTFCFKKYEAST